LRAEIHENTTYNVIVFFDILAITAGFGPGVTAADSK